MLVKVLPCISRHPALIWLKKRCIWNVLYCRFNQYRKQCKIASLQIFRRSCGDLYFLARSCYFLLSPWVISHLDWARLAVSMVQFVKQLMSIIPNLHAYWCVGLVSWEWCTIIYFINWTLQVQHTCQEMCYNLCEACSFNWSAKAHALLLFLMLLLSALLSPPTCTTQSRMQYVPAWSLGIFNSFWAMWGIAYWSRSGWGWGETHATKKNLNDTISSGNNTWNAANISDSSVY